jgi:DNA-binding NarL/FixJ family response regulator
VVAEDEALLREGLRALLAEAGIDVAATAAEAGEVAGVVAEVRPDLLITDIRMPPGHADDGLRAALELRGRRPRLPVMVLSQYVQRQYAVELLADDPQGVGYLLKQRVAHVDTFCDDLRRVAAGGTVLDPDVVQVMMARANATAGAIDSLTERQCHVLALIAEGRSNSAIAARLKVSEKAVVAHTSRIYDQLGIPLDSDDHRRVLAVLRYLNG